MSFDLKDLLREHVQFLRASCAAFDAGFDGEAKRMAVSARVLLHDTANSHSLLDQMGLKGVGFYTTSFPWSSTNLLAHHGLLAIKAEAQGASYVSLLDDIPPPYIRWTPFNDWWNEIIFDDRKGSQLKRRDIVLGLANKEGGAHVDPKLSPTYEAITRKSQFWTFESGKGSKPLEGKMERVTMRQIGHEVLRTIEKHAGL